MEIALKPYEPGMLEDMIPTVAQGDFLEEPPGSPAWTGLLRATLASPWRILRAVYDAQDGTCYGYCEIPALLLLLHEEQDERHEREPEHSLVLVER